MIPFHAYVARTRPKAPPLARRRLPMVLPRIACALALAAALVPLGARAQAAGAAAADSTRPRSDSSSSEYPYETPVRSQLLFGPTGRTLRAGEGVVALHQLLLAGVTVGVTDWFTLGVSAALVPLGEVWVVSPKVALVRGEEWNVAAGAMGVRLSGEPTGGIAYLATTYGSPDHSVTLGLGRTFVGGAVGTSTIVMLGTEQRMDRVASLVSENYIFPGGRAGLASLAVRFMASRVAVDVGYARGLWDVGGEGAGAPWVGVAWKF